MKKNNSIQGRTEALSTDQDTQSATRRNLVKAVFAGGAVTTSSIWVKPVVDSVLLPAHAQTTSAPGAGVITMPAASAAASSAGGVEVVIEDAEPGETVVVTARVAAAEVSVSVKADAKGRAAASISSEAIKSAVGRDLKAGETIVVKAVTTVSRRQASLSLQVKEAVATPLVVSLSADADAASAQVSVQKAKAGELVSAKVMVSGREIVVSGKANAEGVARMEVSADALKRAGASLVRGEMISATVTSASGAKGSATATVIGRDAAALEIQSVSGNMTAGISLALSGAKAGELVTLNARAGEKSIAFKMKADESGALKSTIGIAQLKELELKEGSEVVLSVATESGQKAERSIKMAGASSGR